MPPWPPAKLGLDAGKWSCKDPRRLEPATWFPARPRAGARLSLEESRRKEHQGGERFSPPWTHLSLVGGQGEVFSMFRDWPAALHPTPVTARPPAGRAGKRGFADGKGRPCTQPFLVEVEKEASGCRPNGMLLLPRWATRSPPHPSPPVTASPRGEASGSCNPTRKSVPNQGT